MPDLFDLSAKISVDAKGVDSTLTSTQKKVHSLADSFRKADTTAKSALEGIARSTIGSSAGVSRLSNAFESLGGTLGVATLGIGVLSAAAVGLGSTLFQITKNAADAAGKLFDLSQKTNFSVETLSALSNLADATGSNIDTLSGSLVIFQSNMVAARVKTSEMGKTFDQLKISTQDQEKALRQAITALAKMGATETQAAMAKQVFGRAGKDVLGILKETNGDLDAAIEKYRAMGLLISTDTARASDKFNDTLEETEKQLSAVTRQIGFELLPVATGALQDISNWLALNKDQWTGWGTAIGNVISGVKSIVESEVGTIIGWIARLSLEINGVGGALRYLGGIGASARASQPGEDIWGPGGLMRGGPGSLKPPASLPTITGGGGGGGSRRGGGGGSKESEYERMVKQLTSSYDSLTAKTEVARIAQQRLNQAHKDFTPVMWHNLELLAAKIDRQKEADDASQKQANALKSVQDLLQDQTDSINRARLATDQWQDQELDLARALTLAGVKIDKNTYAQIRANSETLRTLALTRQRIALEETLTKRMERPRWADPKNWPRNVGIEPSEGDETRPRRVMQKDTADWVKSLAGDLTRSIDNAIYEGFHGGVKRGLQSMAMDLLDFLKNIFLKRLEQGLTDALSKVSIGAGGGGGGGFLGFLSKFILPIIGAAAGGAIAGGGGGHSTGNPIPHGGGGTGPVGHFASGIDFVPRDMLAVIHKGERVVPASENHGGVIINVFAKDAQSFASRETRAQIAKAYHGALMKPILTG